MNCSKFFFTEPLWLHFYPGSSQHFCPHESNYALSPFQTSSDALDPGPPPASGSHSSSFPSFSLFSGIPPHPTLSHFRNLLLVPCPKSKPNPAKDSTRSPPRLISQSYHQLFPDTNKILLFSSTFFPDRLGEGGIGSHLITFPSAMPSLCQATAIQGRGLRISADRHSKGSVIISEKPDFFGLFSGFLLLDLPTINI